MQPCAILLPVVTSESRISRQARQSAYLTILRQLHMVVTIIEATKPRLNLLGVLLNLVGINVEQ